MNKMRARHLSRLEGFLNMSARHIALHRWPVLDAREPGGRLRDECLSAPVHLNRPREGVIEVWRLATTIGAGLTAPLGSWR